MDQMELMHAISANNQQKRLYAFEHLNHFVQPGQIVMTGSSLMQQFEINELVQGQGVERKIYNRGIGGFTTDDFIAHWDLMLFDLKPAKVFINIGTNDLNPGGNEDWQGHLLSNYERIMDEMVQRLPHSRIYVMAYYPTNPEFAEKKNPGSSVWMKNRSIKKLAELNGLIEKMAEKHSFTFINVNDGLTNDKGFTKEEFCVDGIHLNADGYAVVLNNLMPDLKGE